MRNALRHRLAKALLVFVFAFSAAAIGFAHRVISPADQAAAVYALEMGTSAADLCGEGGQDSHRSDSCPACHLVGSADLPAPGMIALDLELRFLAEVIAPRESCAVRSVLDPALGMRAPPIA